MEYIKIIVKYYFTKLCKRKLSGNDLLLEFCIENLKL